MLETMEVGAKPIADQAPQPAAWVRHSSFKGGQEGRAFCSTQGASEDILSEGVRRIVLPGWFPRQDLPEREGFLQQAERYL